jgi:hypothetical protein
VIRVKVVRDAVSVAFRSHKHEWYTATEDPDGTIHLVPYAMARVRLKAAPGPEGAFERAGT